MGSIGQGHSMLLYTKRGAVWIIVYLLFILAPLFALLAGSLPPPRDFWTEFSVAIGYAGLAMMGLQFGLTARFRYVTEPWGEDVIYHFHRQISLIAVGLVIAHPLILFVIRPELLVLLNSIDGAVARSLRCVVDLFTDRSGGDGPVARAVEDPLRDVASDPYRPRIVAVAAGSCIWWDGASIVRALEANLVDMPDDLLDWTAVVRAHRQAAVRASPAVPRFGSAQGTRRHLDIGDAS